MAADNRKLDVARFLPPNLRDAMRTRYFPTVRVAAWLLLAGGIVAYRTVSGPADDTSSVAQEEAGARRVSVTGNDAFALLVAPADQGILRSLEIGGTRYPIDEGDGVNASIKDPAGGTWAVVADDEGFSITENDQPRFRMKHGDEGYSVRGISGEVLFKVKKKEEKVNLYGADEQRLRHGKVKKGDVQWKDETDTVVLRVSGEALWESAILALPISPQARALGWAFQSRALTEP